MCDVLPLLRDYIDKQRVLIESQLRASLSPEPGLPDSLREAMSYSLLAPGKRLRPLLVLMAAEALGGASAPWPAACAVEMIHAYSLIHDDLPAMDDDDLRRGQPTCHRRFGEALAILAGDALQARAFELLAVGYPPVTAAAACRELAHAAGGAGMVGGQVDDLAMEERLTEIAVGTPRPARTLDALEQLHGRKTGALIRVALRLGVLAACSPDLPTEDLLDRFDGYGRRLGLAFQITDDLLDAIGEPDKAGKRVQKDAARGKLTYPGLLGIDESRSRAERLCREAADCLRPLGPSADLLIALADYVLHRDH
jgi:geranylgeranyl diphosphate synthase type II